MGSLNKLTVSMIGAALLLAGVATAAIMGRTITLASGHCVKVAKTRVCAARVLPVTVVVTGPAATTVSLTTTVTVTSPTPPTVVAFPDGTYRVGVDIQPGTYQASSPTSCYWARLRGFSGGLGDIIANELYVGIVTINPGDVGFQSHSCGSWSRVG
jgi:hypothetical protein